MPYQEKSAIISVFVGVIIFALYFYFTWQNFQSGLFEGADAGAQIGRSILWLIGGGIILNIIAHIGFSIIHAIVTNDQKPSFVVDERDKLIELLSLRFAYYIFGAGFLISMIALALNQSFFIVFNIIIFSAFIASLVEGLMQIFLYRRGF